MRANEFIVEAKVGQLSKVNQDATVGLNKFRDKEFSDRIYELNRVMMAAACNDGTDFAEPVDGESWAGRHDIAAPYTEVEQRMLEKAYKVVGSKFWDLNKGNMRSEELPDTYKTSPVKGFKGYPR
jgi:hypothetical protein